MLIRILRTAILVDSFRGSSRETDNLVKAENKVRNGCGRKTGFWIESNSFLWFLPDDRSRGRSGLPTVDRT